MRKLLILMLTLLPCAISHAQMGTMKWHFNSRTEAKSALRQTRGNLRSTYDVLICAGRQGYTNTGIGYYEEIVAGHEFDASPQDSAAYAFAFDLGYSFRPWGWKRDLDQSMIKKNSRAFAQHFRDRAQAALSNSPEALVMRAFWGNTLEGEERKEAYYAALRAVKLAPRWADAYYWLGTVTGNYANLFSTRITREQVKPNTPERARTKATIVSLGHLQIRAYDKAEKLDSGLRPHLYWPRLLAYQNIRDKKSAQMMPVLAEQHLRAFPNFGAWHLKTFGVSAEQWLQGYKNLAAQILSEQAK